MRNALTLLLALAATEAARGEELTLTVKETAGIRRFSYPVSVKLELPRAATDKDRFRLVADGKATPAQFVVLKDRKSVALDFTASLGPFDKQIYLVEYGPKVEEGPKAKGEMKIDQGKEEVTISSGGMKYVVPAKLTGLLLEVKDGKKSFTRPGSAGLGLRLGKETIHTIGPRSSNFEYRVTRQGPYAVALRFEGVEKLKEGRVIWVVEMTFPRSKSWVEVNWTLEADKVKLDGLLVDLNLLATSPPTLADFGAGSMVYAKLEKGQSAALRARPSHQKEAKAPLWEVLLGKSDSLRSFVRAAPDRAVPAEGWAHLMDRQRCTAIAVDGFGKAHADELRLDDDGRLMIRRSPAVLPLTMKGLRFWLHFVDVPVQVGAVTSPQAMMAPLEVEVK